MEFGNSTKLPSTALDKAESIVTENLAKFETAMEHLTEKMEESSKKIQHVAELAAKQKAEFISIKNKLKTVVAPAQQNPRSFAAIAFCLVGGYFLINYLGNRKSSPAPMAAEDLYASAGMPH